MMRKIFLTSELNDSNPPLQDESVNGINMDSVNADGQDTQLSLTEIIKRHHSNSFGLTQMHYEFGRGSTDMRPSRQAVYQMMTNNPYAEGFQKLQTVQIRLLDLLYNDQICTLVYMHDLTGFMEIHEKKQAHKHLMMANAHVFDELEAP